MKNIIIVGADPYNTNFGVRALFEGCKQVVIKNHPGANFINLIGSREFEKNRENILSSETEHIVIDFSKKMFNENNIIRLHLIVIANKVASLLFFKENFLKTLTMEKLKKADYVLSISAGDSYSDLYGIKNFIYVLSTQLIFILLKIPLYQMPQSYGPFDTFVGKRISKFALEKSKAVFAREKISFNYLKSLSEKIEPKFCYDLGFLMKPAVVYNCHIFCGNNKKLLGINISGLLYFGGYEKEKSKKFGLKEDYRRTLIHMIVHIISEWDEWEIILIPHVIGQHHQSDNRAIEDIYGKVGRKIKEKLKIIEPIYSHLETKYIIGKLDMFIGSRMHSCIAAVSQNVPTISLGYSDKFEGVMESIGYKGSVVDLRWQGIYDIIEKIEDVKGNLNNQKYMLNIKMEKMSGCIEKVIKEIL